MQTANEPITPLDCVRHQRDRLMKQLEHTEYDLELQQAEVVRLQAEADSLRHSIQSLSDWIESEENSPIGP